MKAKIILDLDLHEMLPIIRKAFDEKTLQMFTHEPGKYGCLYAGPCAIGVCIPEPLRPLLDDGIGTNNEFAALSLFENGSFVCPENQREDICELQQLHDVCVGYVVDEYQKDRIKDFGDLLERLEAKYRPGVEL
jgi:hypothetical protein